MQCNINPSTEQTIIYTAAQHQQRLSAYLDLLQRLAASEYAHTLKSAAPPHTSDLTSDTLSLLGEQAQPRKDLSLSVTYESLNKTLQTPDPSLINGLSLGTLRLVMARAALAWNLTLPALDEPLDDALQLSLGAALLLPLTTSPILVYLPHSAEALGSLASPEVAALIQELSRSSFDYEEQRDQQAIRQAYLRLLRVLSDPCYMTGCKNLLHDMAASDPGRTAVAVAWQERQFMVQGDASVPMLLHLFASGAAERSAGSGLHLAVLQVLRGSTESDLPAPILASPPTPGPLTIPIHLDEWQAELKQRNTHFGAPVGYWCYVRPGCYRIGGWGSDKKHADLMLPAFWIARVPITVAQYAAFIEAGGYRERRWWTYSGWGRQCKQQRIEPANWHKPPFNHRPQQALTGIDWYEATAFCNWLTAHLDLPLGYSVRLPNEAEWEAASAFDADWQRRNYPWGEANPTAHYAVFDQKLAIGSPDVATCPAGTAACGALDVSGTVREYCANEDAVYPADAMRLKEEISRYSWEACLRGGSYSCPSWFMHCGIRQILPHDLRREDIGFRVVVSRSMARIY